MELDLNKVSWLKTEQPELCALAARARQASRMEVLLKPRDTHSIIEQLSYGKVYHVG